MINRVSMLLGTMWFPATLSLFIFLGIQPGSCAAEEACPTVRFIISQPLGLLYFLDNLNRQTLGTARIFNDFRNTHPLTKKDQHLLTQFQILLHSNEYCFNGELGQKRTLADELEYQAALHRNTASMLMSLRAKLKKRDLLAVEKTLHRFEPQYELYVWKPCLPALSQQVTQLQQQSTILQLGKYLQQVIILCNSRGDRERELLVALVPIPNETADQLGRDAHCNGSLAVIEMMPKHKAAEKWGTIFHELCHALWIDRSPSAEKQLQRLFTSNKGYTAYQYFPEAFATALGAGWFYKTAIGMEDRYWYANPTIKNYAHALLPLFKSYLLQSRTMDAPFVQQAINRFSLCNQR